MVKTANIALVNGIYLFLYFFPTAMLCPYGWNLSLVTLHTNADTLFAKQISWHVQPWLPNTL